METFPTIILTFEAKKKTDKYPTITLNEIKEPGRLYDYETCPSQTSRNIFQLDKDVKILRSNDRTNLVLALTKRLDLLYGFLQNYDSNDSFDQHIIFGIIHRNLGNTEDEYNTLNGGYAVGIVMGKSYGNCGWFMAKRYFDKNDQKFRVIFKFLFERKNNVKYYVVEDDGYIFLNKQVITPGLRRHVYASCLCPNGEYLYAGVYNDENSQVACHGGIKLSKFSFY